ISRLNSARHQILSGGRSFLDCPCRRNVIGRYRVAKNAKRARASNLFNVPGLHRKILEKRRLVNVVALLVPLVNVAGARRVFVPFRILIGKIAIEFAASLRRERRLRGLTDFTETWPQIAQERLMTIL